MRKGRDLQTVSCEMKVKTKEPCISTKEPYSSAKEPYDLLCSVSLIKACINRPYNSSNDPKMCQKSPGKKGGGRRKTYFKKGGETNFFLLYCLPLVSSKEPCISSNEAYDTAKEPYGLLCSVCLNKVRTKQQVSS